MQGISEIQKDLSSYTLKNLAIFAMFFDHIFAVFVPQDSLEGVCAAHSRADCRPDHVLYDCGRLSLHIQSEEIYGTASCCSPPFRIFRMSGISVSRGGRQRVSSGVWRWDWWHWRRPNGRIGPIR